MPLVGFEPMIAVFERAKTVLAASDRAVTVIGWPWKLQIAYHYRTPNGDAVQIFTRAKSYTVIRKISVFATLRVVYRLYKAMSIVCLENYTIIVSLVIVSK
jgi:hypothetical protein